MDCLVPRPQTQDHSTEIFLVTSCEDSSSASQHNIGNLSTNLANYHLPKQHYIKTTIKNPRRAASSKFSFDKFQDCTYSTQPSSSIARIFYIFSILKHSKSHKHYSQETTIKQHVMHHYKKRQADEAGWPPAPGNQYKNSQNAPESLLFLPASFRQDLVEQAHSTNAKGSQHWPTRCFVCLSRVPALMLSDIFSCDQTRSPEQPLPRLRFHHTIRVSQASRTQLWSPGFDLKPVPKA